MNIQTYSKTGLKIPMKYWQPIDAFYGIAEQAPATFDKFRRDMDFVNVNFSGLFIDETPENITETLAYYGLIMLMNSAHREIDDVEDIESVRDSLKFVVESGLELPISVAVSYLNDVEKHIERIKDAKSDYVSYKVPICKKPIPSVGVEKGDEFVISENAHKHILIEKIKSGHPDFEYVGHEVTLEDGDRIDILCKCKHSGRPVIMELKLGDKSAHKQLRSYSIHYENPILINVTETLPKNTKTKPDIKFMLFSEF